MPPTVVVRFYKDFHFVEEDVSRVETSLGGFGVDELGEYLMAKVHVIAAGGTWRIKFKFSPSVEGETGALAWDASAATIEAALNGTGKGVWTVASIGSLEYEIRMHEGPGATFGVQPGLGASSIDLNGVLEEVPKWTEIVYDKVPLVYGCPGFAEPPSGEIEPGESARGSVPSSRPVSGHRD